MKKLLATLLIVAATNSMAVDITLSPVYTAVDLVRSALVTAVSPFATTIEASAANKEQLEAVKSDALDYLAGDAEQSEVLAETILKIKEKAPDLSRLSDKKIARLIVSALE
jgi:hypothetical protein